MNETLRAGRRPVTPFARRFGTLTLAAVIGLGVLTPNPAGAEGLPPHTDMPAPLLRQSAAVNPDYPQMPAPTVEAHLSAPNAVTGHLDVSWEAIPGAEKYQVILFNGAYHSYWDVPATETSWTTKGKGMFPTPEQLQAGTIDYLRNGTGMELLAQPSPLYEQAYEQRGGTDYSLTDNYYVRVTAVHHDGARPISPATTARIPLLEPDEIPDVSVEELIEQIETDEAPGVENETVAHLESLDPEAMVDDTVMEAVVDQMDVESEEAPDMPEAFASFSAHMGDIFYSPTSKTSGLRHGHVGIGSAKVDATIEALGKGTVVRELENRIRGYWQDKDRKEMLKASRHVVRGRTSNQEYAAYAYAKQQANAKKPYGIAPGFGTSSFYCSELVYRSWWYAGESIGAGTYWAGGYVLPSNIIASNKTALAWKYY